MPGICGIVCSSPGGSLEPLLSDMTATMQHHAWYEVEQHVEPMAAYGRVSLGFVNKAPQPARNAAATTLAVMAGEIHDARNSDAQAAELLAGYEGEGKQFFRGTEGKFAAAIWDRQRQQLILVNDRFGMKPLYYAHVEGKLVFASEIKALLANADVPRERCVRGLSEFFTFGHMLGESTLLEAVRMLPAAAWLIYDAREDRLRVERYSTVADSSRETCTQDTVERRLDAAFQAAVDRRIRDTANLGMSLSGGLDGRTILAAIDTDRVKLRTVCMGMEGSLDHQSAARLAALSNRDHHAYVLDTRFLADFEQHLQHMVHLTDGHYLDQCIVLPTLPYYRQLGIDVLLRGHAGELMHMDKAYNFSLDAAALKITDKATLERWMYGRMCAYMLDGVEGPLFCQIPQPQMESLARESLQACLKESEAIEPQLQRVSHLFVSQRMRRETAMSLAMFDSVVETRVPFLDGDLVDVLMAIPPEQKIGDRLQSMLLKRRKPEFLKIRNSNTGAPMQASPLMQRAATFRMKVLGKLGVPGYQPYERLGLWLRRELRSLVKKILLSERCLERGVFAPDTVRAVVENHLAGKRNHTFLIMAMMIYELGQRKFMDGDPQETHGAGEANGRYSWVAR